MSIDAMDDLVYELMAQPPTDWTGTTSLEHRAAKEILKLRDAIEAAEQQRNASEHSEPVGFVEGLFDEDVIEQFGFKRDQAVYFAPQPAIQLTKNNDTTCN